MHHRACFIGAVSMAALLASACNEGDRATAERTLTATVTLSLEDTLAIEARVPLVVSGEPRLSEIYATLHATVTASTSTRAEAAASKLVIGVERRDRTVAIKVDALPDAVLTGDLTLRVPADLHIAAIEHAGTVDVTGMNNNIQVASASHVKITGARQDVQVGVVSGNAIVEAELDPGSRIDMITGTGDLQLIVPRTISADIAALVKARGTVVPNHPQLPPFHGQPGQAYRVRIGDGLSTVALESDVGNIFIQSR